MVSDRRRRTRASAEETGNTLITPARLAQLDHSSDFMTRVKSVKNRLFCCLSFFSLSFLISSKLLFRLLELVPMIFRSLGPKRNVAFALETFGVKIDDDKQQESTSCQIGSQPSRLLGH